MRIFGSVLLAACALCPGGAAGASLTFSDGICQYRVAFDAAKVDRRRLKATFDYLADTAAPLALGPSVDAPDDLARLDVAQYRADCAAHRARLAAPSFVDVPEVEALRRTEIAALDDACAMTEAKLRAAKGETAALRAYGRAPAACTRWAAALDLPAAELKARFGDMIVDLCRTSTEPGVCGGYLQRESEKAPRDTRMRLAILTQGWTDCASAGLLANQGSAGGAESASDREKTRLREALAKRFKAKALSCAQ